MPSHLDEKRQLREKLILQGEVTEQDVLGNKGADDLANRGRELRQLPDAVKWGIIDRKFVAKRVQTFLLETWAHYEKNGKGATQAASCQPVDELTSSVPPEDEMEDAWLESLQAQASFLDQDYDVFGAIDLSGRDEPEVDPGNGGQRAGVDNGSQNKTSSSLADRLNCFPAEMPSEVVDGSFCLNFESVNLPFLELARTTARVQLQQGRKRRAAELEAAIPHMSKASQQALDFVTYTTSLSSFECWPIIVSWLSRLQWSRPVQTGDDRRAQCTASWVELFIAFALQTGFRFAERDVMDCTSMFTAAVRKLSRHLINNGMEGLANETTAASIRPITGFYLTGVKRRPQLPVELWHAVAHEISAAFDANPDRATFGRGYFIKPQLALRIRMDIDYVLQAGVAAAAHDGYVPPAGTAAVTRRRMPARVGPCLFGCSTTAGRWAAFPRAWPNFLARETLPPDDEWRLADIGGTLCTAHHRQALRMIREATEV